MATGRERARGDARGSSDPAAAPAPVHLVSPPHEHVSGETLAELRRLHERAADGPWWFSPDPTPQSCTVHGPDGPVATGLTPRDAELITVMRSHLGALLDEADRLRSAAAARRPAPALKPAPPPPVARDGAQTDGSADGQGLVRRLLARARR